jgi:hypothetical protein
VECADRKSSVMAKRTKYNCHCPGHNCGLKVYFRGNLAKNCDHRKKNNLKCDVTGRAKEKNEMGKHPCSCPENACSLRVKYAGNFAVGCRFRIEHAKPCDVTGKKKEVNTKYKAALIAALEAAPSPRSESHELSDEGKANAVKAGIVALDTAIAKVREVVGEGRRITHSVFLVSCGAPSYRGVDNAPNKELERTSLTTRAKPSKSKSGKNQRTKGKRGSIVIAVGGLNYKGVGCEDARALYSNRDATIISDCGHVRELAEHVEKELQEYVCNEIIQPNPKSNNRLWQMNGHGGANSPRGPFKVCYGAMVHRPDDEADERYPDASIWSRTLPLDNAVFKNDLHKEAIHSDLVGSDSD